MRCRSVSRVGYSRAHNFIRGASWIRDSRVEISVVPSPVSWSRYWRSRVETVRYAGTCHENLSRRPLGRLGRTRAVARWDGNVALQRWGCGRCRPRDGGRGYRFTARRSPILRISKLLLAESFGALERNRSSSVLRFFAIHDSFRLDLFSPSAGSSRWSSYIFGSS